MSDLENKEFFSLDKKFPEKIMALYGKQLESIKEDVKRFFYKAYDYFPTESEGCCLYCAEKVAFFLNGEIVGGYFITDREISAKEVKVATNLGIMKLCAINRRDRRKASHWWTEIGNWIIDLTAEQFNRFLKTPLPRILIISKDSEVGKRYEAKWRNKSRIVK